MSTTHISIESIKKSKLPEVDFSDISFGRVFSDHLFVADYRDQAWQDARIVPFADMPLSPANSALHYGQSIFEGMKAYKSESEDKILLFRADKNFERFNLSASRMCMPQVPEAIFLGGLKKLLEIDSGWVPARAGYSLYIRPLMFATDTFIGVRPSESYRFLILTSPVGSYYAEPVRVKIETNYARACEGGTGAAKFAGNYAGAMYPARQAKAEGYHQLIWTDAKTHRYIEEAGTMNLMFVLNDTLITAPASDTILYGITRRSIVDLAKSKGMQVEERPIEVKEIINAIENNTLQEAFGAGTAATIAHIAEISHEGKDHKLPPIENRTFSKWVKQELSDLQRGKKTDTRGWIQKI